MELCCGLALLFCFGEEKIKIETATVNNTKKKMCGGTSRIGTISGYPTNVGNKTVNIGITRTKFDKFLRKNTTKSLLFAMTTSAATNKADSAATFNVLLIGMSGNGAGIKTGVF